MKDTFSTYHPAVNFLYFALVLVFSMWFMHPAALCISLAGAFVWSVYLGGHKAMRFTLLTMLPMMLLAAVINPAFNHKGGTILTYLPTGNPLTLESIVYGAAAAAMLIAVILWFSCYNKVMTSDKFVYLFGRIIPALSLVLSMVLRFVPKFQAQLRVVSGAQRCIGRDVSNGSLLQRARHGIRILSIMVTWALENAIETADSMKSRGYGLPGRTAFSIYRFDERDRSALCWICGVGGFILAMWGAGGLYHRYFPTFKIAAWDAWSVSALLAYLLLCATPLIIDLWEDRKWKHLRYGG
ncbi:energy-coupling factor transporter transmembrane component T [Pseudoflavonifractor phocaeensis]|uniref:energy-coupling factor transporter transmembrane component T n=1 Tax=Pseudoflavonifractor phocaeensis TaxID=1870988 RepID=UPI00210D6439|nr:energy-coupling factor transporter transmembrane protein EcfT [Pseudoflavonifractor phocaeensis]